MKISNGMEINEKLLKPYSSKETEDKIYKLWEESGFFNPDVCIEKGITDKDAEHFSMVLPPPNVTGSLHTGHALMLVIQDIMTRYARVQGKKTLWLPGTDHAAIATQSKVEKILSKDGIRKIDLGREEFLKRVEKFAEESHSTIVNQAKKMGASLDWSREAFTLDEKRNKAVVTAFKKMYEDGLIYRKPRVVNWDPKGQTVISDDEIVGEERKTKLYTFKYGKDFPISISTTRPETKVGDVAVAVHPEDERYTQFVGKEYDEVFCGVPIHIKIITDEKVEKDFGTGALGVTPAHSQIDWEMAQTHNLPVIPVINEYAKMTVGGENLIGKKTTEAREIIVEWLRTESLLKEEEINQTVPTAERTGGVIEPLPKLQWFIDVNKKIPERGNKSLKELMLEPVRENKIEIMPDHFEKVYFNWIENLRDWCISRQIWYGHRIPVWYKTFVGSSMEAIHFKNEDLFDKFKVNNEAELNKFFDVLLLDKNEKVAWASSRQGETQIDQNTIRILKDRGFLNEDWIKLKRLNKNQKETEVYCGVEAPKEAGWVQDEDTLDTWFSSGLWSFSTLGWPDKTEDLKSYHPTTVIETGHDILFFWIARMILMSQYLLGDIPFKTVYLHGMVRTADGKKMSKSLGEKAIDPLEIIEKYGNDALRLAMIIGNTPGNDLKLNENDIRGYAKFANKIWNASRFVLEQTKDLNTDTLPDLDEEDKKSYEELNSLLKEIQKEMKEYRFSIVAEKLYHYFWHTFADVIIERSKKKILEGNNADSAKALLFNHLTTLLKALHPFIPFVTEEIWSMMPIQDKKLLMVEKWPSKI